MEEKILQSLHPLERKVLPVLSKANTLEAIEKAAKLSEVEVMRALQWLENKGLVTLQVKEEEMVFLDKNGKEALEKGLVEKRFLKTLSKPLPLNQIAKTAGIKDDEINICVGLLRSKQLITLEKGIVQRTLQGEDLLKKEWIEETFLKSLPRKVNDLQDHEKYVLDVFKKRKQLISMQARKERSAQLTDLGKKLAAKKITEIAEERLTSAHLKEGTWHGKTFRRYNVEINVPKISGGRRHFENEAINYIKRIWLDLGFEEMEGPLLQTSFWNLDALFVPQDHPARAMQDTFYIKDPKAGKLPAISKTIKETHETGGKTGSKGWGGTWSRDIASENVLRTHTTVLSAQTLAKIKKNDLPKKYFAVGKVFRNETLDWSHLFEFFQVEGIVVDRNATFAHLKWYLKEFYKKMGYSDIRLRPAHFPYTEPSVEVDVFDPKRQEWIELGGAGIFRPEVVIPLLGEDIPVLAWGNGLGRIIARYYQLTDIRDIYKNDLKQLREIKAWLL